MNVDARVHAWARLQLSGVSPRPLAALLRAFGSAEGVLGATPARRRAVVPDASAALLDDAPDAGLLQRTLSWLEAPGHGLVAWDDPDYPRALLEIGDPPPVLYCQGRRELLASPAFAIVGSRNATPQGCADAQAFAAALSGAGFAIVSGLAQGIDAAAHRGGLASRGASVAVVGTGLDRVYPAANRDLAHALAERGLLISEFALETPPIRHNFPRRNRLVSGLACGVLVVEATLSSGSLITARYARDQGREVFAVPGSIHSPFSKGAHRLIRDGAKLVETVQDILDELGAFAVPREGAQLEPAHVDSDGIEDEAASAVLRALGFDVADVDTLAVRTGFPAERLIGALTLLELDRRVSALPGGMYQRLG